MLMHRLAVVLSFALIATASVAEAQTPTIPPGSTFTPLNPCRAFDTKKGGARIPANGASPFYVSGAEFFSEQGGTAGGCGVPVWATAVSIALTASAATRPGSLAAWAFGSPPQTTTLSYGTTPSSASAIVPINGEHRIAVVLRGPAIHLTGDVTGYFASAMWGVIGDSGNILRSSGRIISASIQITGNYRVTFDRDISTCAVIATAQTFNVVVSQGGTLGTSAFVYVRSFAGGGVPGAFAISVEC